VIPLPEPVRAHAARARALVLDVDGVLTDGTLYYGTDGEALKAFHVRDGLGLRLLRLEGIHVAVISAKRSAPLERRLTDLRVPHVYLGREDKLRALDELLEATGVAAEDVAYVGDDLVDLPVLARVGLSVSVADAHPRVRERALWVTRAQGGKGAVREVADGLLLARGRLAAACEALAAELAAGSAGPPARG
jgi:3-deoxy-D-manno-octulosonate 8-phosphate phosphatase (KDO 8-P phosphatase)